MFCFDLPLHTLQIFSFDNTDVCYILCSAGAAMLPVPAEGVKKESRPNKKSKWDKVFNTLPKTFILVWIIDLQSSFLFCMHCLLG